MPSYRLFSIDITSLHISCNNVAWWTIWFEKTCLQCCFQRVHSVIGLINSNMTLIFGIDEGWVNIVSGGKRDVMCLHQCHPRLMMFINVQHCPLMDNVQKCALPGICGSWCIRPWARCSWINVQIPPWFPSCPIVGSHIVRQDPNQRSLTSFRRPLSKWCSCNMIMSTTPPNKYSPRSPLNYGICFDG